MHCQSPLCIILHYGFDFIPLAVSLTVLQPICIFVNLLPFGVQELRWGVTFCIAQSSRHEPKVCAKRESSTKRLFLCACLALTHYCLSQIIKYFVLSNILICKHRIIRGYHNQIVNKKDKLRDRKSVV